MKVAFVDYYSSASSPHKDPITIPQGLKALGYEVELVTRAQYDHNSLLGFKVRRLSDWLAHGFGVGGPDVAVAISRFDPRLTSALRAIKAARIPLVVKGDTDGTLGYPMAPNYLRCRPITAHPLNIIRHLKYRMPISCFVRQKIEHIRLADLVVCESPGAVVNLAYILAYWGLAEETKKIIHIPNPVSKTCTEKPVARERHKSVIAIGRWNDYWVKGSDLLAGTINYAASRRPDAVFTVVGDSPDYVSKRLLKRVRERVCFPGLLSFEDSQALVSSARILLVTSRLESFSLVSGEALCSGASLVTTPIESLLYLAGGGSYGSIARNFSVSAISAALMAEMQLWDGQCRDPVAIARHWRAVLSEDRIASIWSKEIERIGCAK